MASLIFKDAEIARNSIMREQQRQISKLYEQWANDIGKKADHYSKLSTPSAAFQERQYRELQKQLKEQSLEVSKGIQNVIITGMRDASIATITSNVQWLNSLGFTNAGMSFVSVPNQIIQNIVTGQIYDSGWSLSQRIWGDREQTLRDAYQVMAKGLAENKPIYEIAKDLERYVRPSAKNPWNKTFIKTMEDGSKKSFRIYKSSVDYNAQRLARTLTQHSYQQSLEAVSKPNPFITGFIWRANGSRVCELCEERDGQFFEKGNAPLDHPNGMCILEPEIDEDKMIDQLADWVNSPEGTYPEIDEFAKFVGGSSSKQNGIFDFISKYGTSTKGPDAWYQSLSKEAKAEAKALKDESGLTWKEWYKQNVYTGSLDDFDKKSAAKWAEDYYRVLEAQDVKSMEQWTYNWITQLAPGEEKAVNIYTSSAYRSMNEYLRGLRKSTYYEEEIKLATSALQKARLPEDVVVRRAAGYNILQEMGYKDGDKISKFVGGTVKDKGFLSTSPDPNGGFSSGIEYIINVPKNSQAMYIAPISEFENEKELIINRGGKFRIDKIEEHYEGSGPKRIFMTLINLKKN